MPLKKKMGAKSRKAIFDRSESVPNSPLQALSCESVVKNIFHIG